MSARAGKVAVAGVLLLAMAGASFAQSVVDAYEPGYFKPARVGLNYRLYTPDDYDANPDKQYPLVLFLHGAGETGDDNLKPVQGISASLLLDRARTPGYEAFVLVPQTPSGTYWTGGTHGSLGLTKLLIDDLVAQKRVDASRLYVTGLSLGGMGTWTAARYWPEDFAAAVPICGSVDPAAADEMLGIPIWAFHAADDNTVDVSGSRDIIAALRALDADPDPLYTEYPTGGHGIWGQVYRDESMWEWMYSQQIPEPATLALSALGALAILRRR